MDDEQINITISSDKAILSFGLNGLRDFRSIDLPNNLKVIALTKEVSDFLENRLTDQDVIQNGHIPFLNGDILERNKVLLVGNKKELMPFIKPFIPVATFHTNHEYVGYGDTKHKVENEVPEYFCCCSNPKKRNKFHNIIIHEDAKSSLNCICEFLKTDYILVLNNE